MAPAKAWHGLLEHVGTAGGDVTMDKLLLLVVERDEVSVIGELELLEKAELKLPERELELEPLLGIEIEHPSEVKLELLEGLVYKVLDGSLVRVPVTLTRVHGVVGLALAQAQREFAAPKTAPAEAPQLLITQFKAADWIAEDWELEHWHW